MLKEKLLKRLKEYENNNEKLIVKWNTGGDETIINFYLKGNVLPYHTDEIVNDLASYLIEEFDLPNAGEYYNDGGGEISIDKENKILFVYDEFAYGESYDENFDTENIEEEFSIITSLSSKQLLNELNQKELDFYGSTSFLLQESDDFRAYTTKDMFRIKKEKLREVHEHIKVHILSKLSPPFEATEIGYSGKIKEDEILIEELYQTKYYIDKNKKNEKVYLLEKKANI